MSNSNNSKSVNKEAMNRFKMECANDLDVPECY